MNFSEIVGRVREITGWKSDNKVAEYLGITPQNLANKKASDAIPTKEQFSKLHELAIHHRVNFGWLLTGEPPREQAQSGPAGSVVVLNRTEEAVVRTLRFLGPDYAQDVYFSLRKQAQREARERELKGRDLEDLESALDVLGKAAIE